MENKVISSHDSTGYGYMVEWRLKEESKALTNIVLANYDLSTKWQQAQYNIDTLGKLSDTKLIRPYISNSISYLEKSQYGLVTELVAEAILACLKTSVDPRLEDHIEWRIACFKLKTSHEMIRDDK